MFFFNKLPIIRRMIEELSHATAQIKVRAAFTIMLAFVALSENIGTEVILGAFLAGAIVSLLKTPQDAELEHQLNTIGFGFFIPIFFIMVGVDFNFSALLTSSSALWLAPMLIIAALFVKVVPALIYKVNFSWRETLGAGTLLSARLSLIIAASAIGLRLGIISESVNAAIVLVAVVTVSLAPTIFSKIVPGEDRTQKRPIIVVGAGEFGIQLAENLRNHHEDVVVVAETRNQQKRAEGRDFTVVLGNAENPDENLIPYFENTRTLVCVFSDVEKCYGVCSQASTQFGIDHVVARVSAPGEINRFEKIGVTTMSPTLDQVSLLGMLARNPSLYSILTRTDDDKDVCEIPVRQPKHFGKRIRDLDLPGDLVIVALERDGEYIIPTGSTELEQGDKLSLLGNQTCIDKASAIFRSV
jgi:Trk K+ transport system NAD-binding subunit